MATGIEGRTHIERVGVARQEDHASSRAHVHESLRSFETIEPWHRDIKHDGVRLNDGGGAEKSLTVPDRVGDVKGVAQEFLQALPDQGMILGDQNPRMCIDGQSPGT